mgnify:CR=1 FL=1
MLLNNEWVNNEIKEETKGYLETNENENTMAETLWDMVNAVLRGKFITIHAYQKQKQNTKTKQKSQINSLTLN